MKRYAIQVDGLTVKETPRIDYARTYFKKQEVAPGVKKTLLDTQSGKALDEHMGKAPKRSKIVAKRKADKGDAVAVYLRDLNVDETVFLARGLLNRMTLPVEGEDGKTRSLMTPGKVSRDSAAIQRASDRAKGKKAYEGHANPGSARMSLGNMIRKYVKKLQTVQEKPEEASTILESVREGGA